MTTEMWAVVLIGLTFLFFVLEVLIPSGGLLGLMSAVCLISANVCLFMISTTAGMIGMVASLILVPVAFFTGLKIFPHTPIGRILILGERQKAGADGVKYEEHRDADPQSLVGARGQAVSELRPVGICSIDGRRLECISISGVIDRGTSIQVDSVQGMEVRVKSV